MTKSLFVAVWKTEQHRRRPAELPDQSGGRRSAFPTYVRSIAVLAFSFAGSIALAQPQQGYIDVFSCDGGPLGLRLPRRLSSVMKLAPSKREEVLEVEKWDGYTTTRKYVYFPGLTIGLITFSNDKTRYMVSFAEISDPRWTHIAPFRIGEPTESVRRKIGSFAENDPTLKVRYGSEAGDVSFVSVNGKIKKITYDCYTG